MADAERITISFPDSHNELHDWLVSQKNASDTVRRALYLLREREEGTKPPETPETQMLRMLGHLMSIKGQIAEIGERIKSGMIVASDAIPAEDQSMVTELLDSFGDLDIP